jgi:predicted nucleotidyltransferase
MVSKSVVRVIKKYLSAVSERGIPVTAGVVFGSYAKGKPHQWSDIDLLVVSSRFDKNSNRRDIDLLWHVAAEVDSRIEPIAVGEKQYKEDNSSWIIAVARREGEIIPVAE